MNSKHAFLALSVFTLVSIAHGEREVFAPTKLAPTAIGTNLDLTGGNSAAPSSTASTEPLTVGGYTGTNNIAAGVYGALRGILLLGGNPAALTQGIGSIKMLYGARSTTDENAASIVALQGSNTTNDSTSGGFFSIDTRPTGGAALIRRLGIMSTGDIVAGQADTGYTTGTPPNDTTIRSTQITGGTDVPGASLTIAAGSSTGSASGGSLRFSTAPSGAAGATPNAVVERMRISSTGNVFVGNGETAASVANGNIRATGGSGTNINGADLVLHGGQSTGTASGGALRFFTAPASGVSGTSVNASTERMRISSTGRVGIGTTNPAAALHVVQPNVVQQFLVQDVETDATNKFGTFATGHYTNSEEPVVGMLVSNGTSSNTINIGGGSGSHNAATTILFTTAANNTTLAGTERLRITSTGVMQMASGSYIDAGAGKFELPNGTAIPATCTVGELFQDTDSNDCINTGGGDGALCICKTTNTWALISNF